jgi:predicted aspartyl protease
LRSSILSYGNHSTLSLEIILDKSQNVISEVIIDTGFTTSSMFGLKLPLEYVKYPKTLYTSTISLADTTEAHVQYAQAIIAKVEAHELKRKIPLWTIFMKGRPLIGLNFLKRCKICFDGPSSETTLDFDF